MAERTHTLTDEHERYLRDALGLSAGVIESIRAEMASRTHPDPDAGLGAQPWRRSGHAIMVGREQVCAVYVPHQAFNQDAVARAILATPKLIKLAREIKAADAEVGGDSHAIRLAWRDVCKDAAKALAIVDGEVGNG